MPLIHPDTSIIYRPMTDEDLAGAHRLSQAVRWPHRLEDWQFVHRLGIGFVAEQDGAVVGTGMGWKQGKRFGSLGMMIVSPEHQGQGIGRQLMMRVLGQLGERCTLLSATPAGQPLYESLGFRPTGTTIHQHQGTMLRVPAVALARSDAIRPITGEDIPTLIELENRATGFRRDELLKHMASAAHGVVLECDGEIRGFSAIRDFGRGRLIGPVIAPDSERAAALIAYWSAAYADSFVRVDVTVDGHLGDSLDAMGLMKINSVVAMARNGLPPRDQRIAQFAIANQALC